MKSEAAREGISIAEFLRRAVAAALRGTDRDLAVEGARVVPLARR